MQLYTIHFSAKVKAVKNGLEKVLTFHPLGWSKHAEIQQI